MENEIVNVFSVTVRGDDKRIVSNSIQFYIGQLLVMEYTFETPILFCTVLNLQTDRKINLKHSIPFSESHLVACDKDGRGHVWQIDEIISQITKRENENPVLETEYPPEESYMKDIQTPTPNTFPKKVEHSLHKESH